MSDKTKLAIAVLFLLSIAAITIKFYIGMALTIPSLLLYYREGRRQTAVKDSEAHSFIYDFINSYKRNGTLYAALKETSARGYSFSRSIASICKSYELGLKPSDAVEAYCPESKSVKSFMRIVAMSLESGQEIDGLFDAFKDRLSKNEAAANALISKTQSMKSLSRLGIMIFFPIFAGISASILSNSSAIVGGASAEGRFSIIVIAYTTMMLAISHAIDALGSQIGAVLYKLLPSLNIAIAIFYATMHFLPGFLW
ncbi:MAG: hypothetical protein QXD58_01450 [Candidatus Micrarchaeaceae archaeon]